MSEFLVMDGRAMYDPDIASTIDFIEGTDTQAARAFEQYKDYDYVLMEVVGDELVLRDDLMGAQSPQATEGTPGWAFNVLKNAWPDLPWKYDGISASCKLDGENVGLCVLGDTDGWECWLWVGSVHVMSNDSDPAKVVQNVIDAAFNGQRAFAVSGLSWNRYDRDTGNWMGDGVD